MTSFIAAYDAFYGVARLVVFGAGLLAAVVFALDWAARTRRISPFSPIARFTRRSVDPLLAPIERRVLRMGGNPVSAPWWALVAVVVGGIILLSLLGFVRDQVILAYAATRYGGRGIVQLAVVWIFGILKIALIVVVLSSWVGGSRYTPWLRWAFRLTDPILGPLSRVIPKFGMIDVTPLVAYFGLVLLQGLILGAL